MLVKQKGDHAKLKDAIASHRAALRKAAEDANTIDVQATEQSAAPEANPEDADYQRTVGAAA